ncbi:GNAT family N-acetyltransferase [Nocardiopsis ansamitocini]|nr:GNAT family N-acetyltransferase [Nocardiopsis ansamitocini]
MTDLLAGAVDEAVEAFWALGGETRALNGAHLVRNRSAGHVGFANFVTRLVGDDPVQVADVLGRAWEWIGAPSARVQVGASTPPATEAALVLKGWRHNATRIALVGTAPPPARHADTEVRSVDSPEDWARLAELFRADHEEEDRSRGRLPRPIEHTEQAVLVRRAKTPDVHYWLACKDGVACGFFSSWQGAGVLSVVEDLFVHPDHRGGGIADQLLRHATVDAGLNGARPVLVLPDAGDRPKNFYHRRGFRPVSTIRYYAPPDRRV